MGYLRSFKDLSHLIGYRRSHDMDYFRQCSCLETNPSVLFFTIFLALEEAVTAAKFGTR